MEAAGIVAAVVQHPSRRAYRTMNLQEFIVVPSHRFDQPTPLHEERTTAFVAGLGDEVWSSCGTTGLQPSATHGKGGGRGNG